MWPVYLSWWFTCNVTIFKLSISCSGFLHFHFPDFSCPISSTHVCVHTGACTRRHAHCLQPSANQNNAALTIHQRVVCPYCLSKDFLPLLMHEIPKGDGWGQRRRNLGPRAGVLCTSANGILVQALWVRHYSRFSFQMRKLRLNYVRVLYRDLILGPSAPMALPSNEKRSWRCRSPKREVLNEFTFINDKCGFFPEHRGECR